MKKLFLMFMTVIFGLSLAACYDDEDTTPVELTDLETAFTDIYTDYSTHEESTIDSGKSYVVKDADGAELGNAYVLDVDHARGDLPVLVALDTTSKVLGVEIMDWTHSTGYDVNVDTDQYDNMTTIDSVLDAELSNVDGDTSSTQSSSAVQYAVAKAISLDTDNVNGFVTFVDSYADWSYYTIEAITGGTQYTMYYSSRGNVTTLGRAYELTSDTETLGTSGTYTAEGTLTILTVFDADSEIKDVVVTSWDHSGTHEANFDDTFYDSFDGLTTTDTANGTVVAGSTVSTDTINSLVNDAIACETAVLAAIAQAEAEAEAAAEAAKVAVLEAAFAVEYDGYDNFTTEDNIQYTIYGANSVVLGYVYRVSGDYSDTVANPNYDSTDSSSSEYLSARGELELAVFFDTNSTTQEVIVLEWNQSSSYESNLLDTDNSVDYYANFDDLSTTDAVDDVTIVSGSTQSSTTVKELIKDAIDLEAARVAA